MKGWFMVKKIVLILMVVMLSAVSLSAKKVALVVGCSFSL